MSLIDKLRKNSTIKEASVLSESKFFTEKEQIPTDIPMLNVALGGSIQGGLGAGLTMIAGPSKHFKSNFALKMVSTFLAKKKDGVVMFYDSEFGSPDSYFKSFGINTDNVLHLPIKNVEELKFDIVKQLEELDKKDNVMILIDSIGNLASKKEIDDALKENAAADMSRAKQLKSLFRMVTPYLTFKDIPMIVINHTYQEIGLFPKQIVGGGTGSTYSANAVWIVGRSQEKTGTEITGWNFTINIEKSRFVKEKSKIEINVTYDGGIDKFSGLLDNALEGGYVIKPSNGWYSRAHIPDDKKFREKDTHTDDFWNTILNDTNFPSYLEKKYKLVTDISFDNVLVEEPDEDDV
jgi:RecA/RadA recombinase